MDWKTIFQNQAKLDAHIEEKHPRQEGENRLLKKIIALQVELAEMAQEFRGFKFWSNDQEPKTFASDSDPTAGLYREWNPLLEEYIDVVHFTASLGLELNLDELVMEEQRERSVLEYIQDINFATSLSGYGENHFKMYPTIIGLVTALGQELGFTDEQIMEAYNKKNATNFERQKVGY